MPPTTPPDPFTIRPLTLADLEHVVRHRVSMFRDMGHTDEALLARIAESARAYLSTAIPRSAYCGWLVESPEGEVVAGAGILIAEWPGSPADPGTTRAWILNVYTVPAWRRRGLARRLVTTATDWCRQHGLGFIALHASREGRRVYEALGFTPTNEMRLEL